MTKEDLKQYRSIVAELNEVNDRINSNTVHGTVTGSDSEFPYVKHCISVSGVEPTHISDIVLRQRLERQKNKIELFVAGILDSETRRIFRYRYIDGTRNAVVAVDCVQDRAVSGDVAERRKHDKFLKVSRICLKKV